MDLACLFPFSLQCYYNYLALIEIFLQKYVENISFHLIFGAICVYNRRRLDAPIFLHPVWL